MQAKRGTYSGSNKTNIGDWFHLCYSQVIPRKALVSSSTSEGTVPLVQLECETVGDKLSFLNLRKRSRVLPPPSHNHWSFVLSYLDVIHCGMGLPETNHFVLQFTGAAFIFFRNVLVSRGRSRDTDRRIISYHNLVCFLFWKFSLVGFVLWEPFIYLTLRSRHPRILQPALNQSLKIFICGNFVFNLLLKHFSKYNLQ